MYKLSFNLKLKNNTYEILGYSKVYWLYRTEMYKRAENSKI